MAPTPRTLPLEDAAFAHTIQAAFAATIAADDAAKADAPAVLAPEAFVTGASRYEVTGTIGVGGMGRVLEARDRQFGRVVAIKETLDGLQSAAGLKRFVQESLVTANLEHPGIPSVYERGVREGRPYYAMRKLSGRTLTEALADARLLADRLRLLPVLIHVAHTVGFAHERGVVHRDLKPDNVIVARHGETAVLDWGIAKVRGLASLDAGRLAADGLVEGIDGAARTVQGSVLGTPAYMAPEQARGQNDRVDERTDVFALGAMLYELLSGSAPYAGPTGLAVLSRAIEANWERLSSVARGAPAGLVAICEKAMAADPADRYPNAARFAEALEEFQTGAVVGEESRAVKWLVSGMMLAAPLIVAVFSPAIARVTSPISAQGFSAWLYLTCCAFGSILIAVEWRTRGRHRLAPLALAFALGTVLTGVAGLTMALAEVTNSLTRPEILENAPRYRLVLAQGLGEALGNITVSALLCAGQLLAWFACTRALARAGNRRH